MSENVREFVNKWKQKTMFYVNIDRPITPNASIYKKIRAARDIDSVVS